MNVQWRSKYIKHQMLPISELRINLFAPIEICPTGSLFGQREHT